MSDFTKGDIVRVDNPDAHLHKDMRPAERLSEDVAGEKGEVVKVPIVGETVRVDFDGVGSTEMHKSYLTLVKTFEERLPTTSQLKNWTKNIAVPVVKDGISSAVQFSSIKTSVSKIKMEDLSDVEFKEKGFKVEFRAKLDLLDNLNVSEEDLKNAILSEDSDFDNLESRNVSLVVEVKTAIVKYGNPFKEMGDMMIKPSKIALYSQGKSGMGFAEHKRPIREDSGKPSEYDFSKAERIVKEDTNSVLELLERKIDGSYSPGPSKEDRIREEQWSRAWASKQASLKDQLIKLGSQEPELRRHLKPVLDTITKTASDFQDKKGALKYFGAVVGDELGRPEEMFLDDVGHDEDGNFQGSLVLKYEGQGPDYPPSEIHLFTPEMLDFHTGYSGGWGFRKDVVTEAHRMGREWERGVNSGMVLPKEPYEVPTKPELDQAAKKVSRQILNLNL